MATSLDKTETRKKRTLPLPEKNITTGDEQKPNPSLARASHPGDGHPWSTVTLKNRSEKLTCSDAFFPLYYYCSERAVKQKAFIQLFEVPPQIKKLKKQNQDN